MAVTLSRREYCDMYGPTVGDRIHLADTGLIAEIEKDYAASCYGDEILFGGGKTDRDGMGNMAGKMPDLDSEESEKKMAQMEAMIFSMTPEERRNPDLLNPSRKHRIAKGAGVDIADVNRMVKQFNESRKMMKKLPGLMGGKGGKRGRFRLPF